MLADTSDESAQSKKSLICVPLKKYVRGITASRKLKKLVAHSSDTAEIYFEDVRVPVRNLDQDVANTDRLA